MFLERVRKKIRKKLSKTKQKSLHELSSWADSYQNRKNYCSGRDRHSFYDLAGEYLPLDQEENIVDIGAGLGYFAEYLQLEESFRNLYLLDGDEACVHYLREKFRNVKQYKAPDRLPFDDESVSFIHCSHVLKLAMN